MTREPSPAMKLLLDRQRDMLGPGRWRVMRLLWMALAATLILCAVGFFIDSPFPPLLSIAGTIAAAIMSRRWRRRLERLNAEIAEQASIDEEERQEQRRAGFQTRLREVIRPVDKA